MLTIALPKGRLADETLELFGRSGLSTLKIDSNSRELIQLDSENGYRFLQVRSQDVGTYVERGIADIGVSGRDLITENQYNVLPLLDLKIGYCKLMVATTAGNENVLKKSWIKVATKYTHLTSQYFHKIGLNAVLVKLYGSIEIAPVLGMSDCIVDLVSTGATLKANGLVEVAPIMESTAQLITNRQAMALQGPAIEKVFRQLEKIIA